MSRIVWEAEEAAVDAGLAVAAPGAGRPIAITLDYVVAEQHAARRDLPA